MLESTLVANTISQIPQYLDLGDNFIASREIPAGRRFIDILYVDLNDDFEKHQNSLSRIASLSSSQLSILSFFIDGNRKSKHYISTYFNLKWETINDDYLNIFNKKRLLTKIGNKTFQATDWLNVIPKKLISIEAKIEDWQTVLNQAKYNTKYTSESYILFPECISKKIDHRKNNIKRDNIGIFSADQAFNLRFEHQPKLSYPDKKSHISDFMKLSILKSYYKNPEKWDK